MVYRANPVSTTWLPPADRERLLASLESWRPGWSGPGGINPRDLLLFHWDTGAHPDVPAHPRMRMLRYRAPEDGEGGMLRALWTRPKNERKMNISATPRLAALASRFIDSLPEEQCDVTPSKRHGLRPQTRVPRAEGQKDLIVKNSDPYCDCYQRISQTASRALGELGFPDVTLRTIRHTWGRRVAEASRFNPFVVSYNLGCSVTEALNYTKSSGTELDAAIGSGRV